MSVWRARWLGGWRPLGLLVEACLCELDVGEVNVGEGGHIWGSHLTKRKGPRRKPRCPRSHRMGREAAGPGGGRGGGKGSLARRGARLWGR